MSAHPIGTPTHGLAPNTGVIATAAWLAARELYPRDPKWFVEIALAVETAPPSPDFDEQTATRFLIEIYAEEWGLRFVHGGRASWIRVTDVPFVHGRDDHELLRSVTRLTNIGAVIAKVERQYSIQFNRNAPAIQTTLIGAEPVIADWVRSL